MPLPDIVGTKEIAERICQDGERVDQVETRVRVWNTRGKLPPREWTIGGRPAWRWSELVRRVPEIRELLTD